MLMYFTNKNNKKTEKKIPSSSLPIWGAERGTGCCPLNLTDKEFWEMKFGKSQLYHHRAE